MTVIDLKGMREAPKAVRSAMQTVLITQEQIGTWRVPPFQREVRVNGKVEAIAEELKQNAVSMSGVLTLGKIGNNPTTYIIDGQHRLEAFKISGLAEIIVDVRMCHFDSMAEAAEEYVRVNSFIVKMRPDDILRGMETESAALRTITKGCEFIGYDQIRRGPNSPIVSVATVLRSWSASYYETPASTGTGKSAAALANALDVANAQQLVVFLLTAHSAWGRDPEYYRLWGSLNMALCMWLWRRLVVDKDRHGKRYVLLTPAEFKKCLMSLSADESYLDWLVGRNSGDRDRSPAYMRIKAIFVKRLFEDTRDRKQAVLPAPAWASK